MSIYAYFTCPECMVCVWLGKVVYPGDRPSEFRVGQREDPPNSRNDTLNRVFWKFLADHAGHTMKVLIEGDKDFEKVIEDYVEIGGDETTSISFDEYLKNWKG